ncbi:unnamed protein product [Closterium sp. Naga37s-1]|nr:unnamed protein product [Closterium sp. Naga37s-1]
MVANVAYAALRDALAQSQSNHDRLASFVGSLNQRLSALDTALRPTQEHTCAIRKVRVNVDKALTAAEVVLEKYDVARQVEGCIKEGPQADLEPYLAGIARLHEGVAYFEAHRSFKSAEAALAHSKALLREGHHRLENALRQQLLQFTKEPDPAKLWDASQQGEEEAGGEGEKVAGGEGEEERNRLPVLLADGRAGDRIRELAEALIQIGRGDKCLKTYIEVRGMMVEAGLRRIGVERLTHEEMDCMVWVELDTRIAGWRKHISLVVHVVFPAERELCGTVLAGLEPHTGKAFADLAGLTLGMLFGFGEAVASQKKPLSKAKELMNTFEKLLLMYDTTCKLMPQVEVVFAGPACDSIRGSAQQLLQHLAAAAKEAFYGFERAVESDESMHSPPLSMPLDGIRHSLTSFVFNFLDFLTDDDYQATMQQLFGSSSLFSEATKRVLAALYSNVERRSRQYGDAALAQFFLMNNTHYVVEGVHKGRLKEVVGADWIYRQRRIVQQHAVTYRRTSWNKIIGLLSSAGLAEDGKEGSVSRGILKERFRVFSATFEELHGSQCVWKIPDPELRSALQLQIAELLLPAYRSFVQRYTPVLRSGGVFGRGSEAASKYIRFTDEALEVLLHEFFQGRESRNILLTQPSAAC